MITPTSKVTVSLPTDAAAGCRKIFLAFRRGEVFFT